MFRILEDITIQYCNGQLFISLIDHRTRYTLEISNRTNRIVNIELKELEQGKRIVNQILPTLNKVENYFEARELIDVFEKTKTYKEAAFLIRVYKTKLSFTDIDSLSMVYHLRTEIHCGQRVIDGINYDLSFYVYWHGISRPIGSFSGLFNQGFIFIPEK